MIGNQLTLTFILFVFAVSTSVKFMAAHDGPEPELTAEFVQTQVTDRKVAVEKMIKALEDPRFWATNEDLAVATAKALGELRGPEAVPVLVAHMTEQWPKLPPTIPAHNRRLSGRKGLDHDWIAGCKTHHGCKCQGRKFEVVGGSGVECYSSKLGVVLQGGARR